MGSIVTFLIILSLLILVHELGHFWAAKKFGIKVEEFGFGYPPRIWGQKIGETMYSLNWLPFGGFVRLFGEEGPETVKKDLKKAFFKQKKRVRIAVLTAGVVMNFLLGAGLFALIYTKIGIPEKVDYLVVTAVVADSPAAAAGIKPEDKIMAVEGMDWAGEDELVVRFVDYVKSHRGQEVRLYLKDKEVTLVPRKEVDTPEGQGALGVAITNMDLVQYPYWQRPFRGIWVGWKEAMGWGKEIVISLRRTLIQAIKGKLPADMAGPVGIYQISKDVAQEGVIASLQFMGILSINLAILNLLPIPALDGGRLLFIAIEVVLRKRIKPKLEQTIHLIGMALLLGLMVLVTINDIRRLIG